MSCVEHGQGWLWDRLLMGWAQHGLGSACLCSVLAGQGMGWIVHGLGLACAGHGLWLAWAAHGLDIYWAGHERGTTSAGLGIVWAAHWTG